MGYLDAVEVFEGLRALAERQAQADAQRQAQGHDAGAVLRKFEGRRILWQGV